MKVLRIEDHPYKDSGLRFPHLPQPSYTGPLHGTLLGTFLQKILKEEPEALHLNFGALRPRPSYPHT